MHACAMLAPMTLPISQPPSGVFSFCAGVHFTRCVWFRLYDQLCQCVPNSYTGNVYPSRQENDVINAEKSCDILRCTRTDCFSHSVSDLYRRQEIYCKPLRECESKTTGDFDTECDGDLYVPSLPLCGRGQKLNNACVTTSQVSKACTSCERGFFQEYNNKCRTCHQCSVCGAQQRTVQPCNAEQDTVCKDLDPTPVYSPETDIPSGSTDTEAPKTAALSSSTNTDGTASGTTPGRTSTSRPTTAAPDDPPILTTGEDVHTCTCKVDTSAQDGTCKAVIPLVICVVLLSFLLAVALICCVCYRNKYMANQRRIPVNNADEDIEGQDPRYTVREAIPMDPFHLENGGKPPSPPVSPVRPPERPDGGHPQCSFPNGLNNGHPRPPLTHDEPLYATVNKTGNLSKTVAADLQRPKSSSGHCHKNAVCKAIGKVWKGRTKGAGKKETEPGSVVEKGRLLSAEPVALDDHQELGGSKRSQPMHGTGPTPSVLPTASPSPSPPPTPSPPTPPLLSPSSSSPPQPSPPLSSPSSSPSTTSPPPLPSSPSSPPPPSSPLPQLSPSSSPPSPPLSPPPSLSSSTSPPPLPSTSKPPLPTPSSSPPSSSPHRSSPPPPSSSSPPPDGIPAQENGLGEGDVEKDNGGAATKEGHDTNAHSPGEETSSTSSSVGAKVTNDLVRGAEGGASSLPPVAPGVKSKIEKNLPEPGDEVGEEKEEELKNTSINPDEIVSENFLDDVTDVINLTSLERISRKFGLTQVVIDNLKDSLRNTSPKNIGFHILQAVLKYQGCKLTFRCLLTAIRDCGNNNAADKLIATFRIDLNLEKR